MPKPTTIRDMVIRLEQGLADHIKSDEANFRRIEEHLTRQDVQLGRICEAVARIDAVQEVAKTAGATAGRSSALKWSSAVATVLAVVIPLSINACYGTNLKPVAPTAIVVPNSAP